MYTFTPIKIGNYRLTVSAPCFATVRDAIRVDVSQTVGLNIRLHPGATSETVTVTADTALQSEQASTGETFSAVMINDMPLDGRNYVFAAQLTTGVAAPNQGFRQVAGAGDFTSNGNRVSQNNFVLDGVDNNSNMQDFLNGATYAVRPPPDALAEFKVESSDYSAEIGRSTGAAINAAIKSGSNQVHGSLWEYLRNDRMDALDYFSKSRTAYAPGFAPRYLNCNGRQNVICPAQVNAVAANILTLFPMPNQGGADQVFNNYTVPATSTTNDTTQYDVRIDYNFSPKDQMFGRYSYSNNPTTFTPPLGILDGGGYGQTARGNLCNKERYRYAKSRAIGGSTANTCAVNCSGFIPVPQSDGRWSESRS